MSTPAHEGDALVEALKMAREYVLDGLNAAFERAEEVKDYPGLAAREKARLADVRADLSLVDTALASASRLNVEQEAEIARAAEDEREGWVLVPKEPTAEMLSHADGLTDLLVGGGEGGGSREERLLEIALAWHLMLEKVPAARPQDAKGGA